MSGLKENVVVVILDEDGYPTGYMITGDAVTLLVVDESCTDDRIYNYTTQSTLDQIIGVIGKNEIGSKGDPRHAAIQHAVNCIVDGKPRLSVVSHKEGEDEE